jgi:hypothetical protein
MRWRAGRARDPPAQLVRRSTRTIRSSNIADLMTVNGDAHRATTPIPTGPARAPARSSRAPQLRPSLARQQQGPAESGRLFADPWLARCARGPPRTSLRTPTTTLPARFRLGHRTPPASRPCGDADSTDAGFWIRRVAAVWPWSGESVEAWSKGAAGLTGFGSARETVGCDVGVCPAYELVGRYVGCSVIGE